MDGLVMDAIVGKDESELMHSTQLPVLSEAQQLNQSQGEMAESLQSLLSDVEAFSELCLQEGVVVAATSTQSLEAAQALSVDVLRSIGQGFHRYRQLLDDARRRNVSLRDSRQLSWAALRFLMVTPTSDFFDLIETDDLVECYDLQHRQTFRTLRFFELCSYDVLSVLVTPWHELYGRDSKLHEEGIREMVDSLEKSLVTKAFMLPAHELWEISSNERRVFEITHKVRAPLFHRNSATSRARAGVIMTSKAQRLR